MTAILVVAAVLIVLALAWAGGRTQFFEKSLIATTIGLLLVSPPLVVAAYRVLHNDEFEPYRGKELYIRSALCALAYAALWGVFSLLVARGLITGDLWASIYVAPPFVLAGGLSRWQPSIWTSATACSITASISWRRSSSVGRRA